MNHTEQIQPQGERLRKAIKWIGEEQSNRPQKSRVSTIREAEIRYNLTPKECTFLEKNFSSD